MFQSLVYSLLSISVAAGNAFQLLQRIADADRIVAQKPQYPPAYPLSPELPAGVDYASN